MQKKIIFFSSQSSDDKNFKIIIPYLKNKYKIRNIDINKYLKIKNLYNYRKNKKKYLFKKYAKIISKSSLVITGSSNHNYEKYIWSISKRFNIKTLCLVDSWVNLDLRFNKKNFTNFISFPNNKIKYRGLKELKKKSKIFYLGQPYLEKISKINFSTKNQNILYLSSRQNHDKDLKILSKISKIYSKFKIILKIHQKDKGRNWLKKLKQKKIKNITINTKSLNDLLPISKYVFGIYTMGLLASIIAKKITFVDLSYKNKNEYLYYLLEKYGYKIGKNIPSEENIVKYKIKKFISYGIYKNSTKKITKLIDDICNSDRN